MKKDYKIQNEIFTLNSEIRSTKIYIPFIMGSSSICKIEINFYEGPFGRRDISNLNRGSGTGFFIKFKKPNSDYKYKYFLMTCEHVIQKEIIS